MATKESGLRKRVHNVNPALIAHSVPLCGCERIPFLVIACISLLPIAATGVVHFGIDLFSVASFVPMWCIARVLYLLDPRGAAKLVDHLSWLFDYYTARRRVGSQGQQPRKKSSWTHKLFFSISRSFSS